MADPSAASGIRRAALAPAKLNLHLEVLGPRPDGYHDLVTLFLALPWGDRVEVEVREEPGVALEVAGDAAVPSGESNLAHRAAREYLARAAEHGVRRGVRIRLEKEVPVGAGLGGGSSDAAAVLRLLREALPVAGLDVGPLARGLGADVPFFLHGGLAVGRGRGDEIEPLPARVAPFDVVLVIPPFGTETARVFAAFDERRYPPRGGTLEEAVLAATSGSPGGIRAAHRNDLARPALAAYPELRAFTRDVERLLGRAPCLSGSGSTLYDVPDRGETDDVLRRLAPLPGRRLPLRTS